MKRIYLVVLDDTPESIWALRFAARRAARTGGGVEILTLIEPVEFVAFGGAQATIEAEAREHAEEMVARAADAVVAEAGIQPEILVRSGDPVTAIRAILQERPGIAALVLGASSSGSPGPLVSHFAGAGSATLPCPLMIVPGSIDEAGLERLS